MKLRTATALLVTTAAIGADALEARAYTIDGGPGPDTIGNDEHSSDARIELGPMTLIGGEGEDTLCFLRVRSR